MHRPTSGTTIIDMRNHRISYLTSGSTSTSSDAFFASSALDELLVTAAAAAEDGDLAPKMLATLALSM
jgi:hypothetical protein